DRRAADGGAAAGVRADQAQAEAVLEQGGVGEVFGETPVARDLPGRHLHPLLVDLRYPRVQLQAVGQGGDGARQRGQPVLRDARVDGVGQVAGEVLRPVDGQL